MSLRRQFGETMGQTCRIAGKLPASGSGKSPVHSVFRLGRCSTGRIILSDENNGRQLYLVSILLANTKYSVNDGFTKYHPALWKSRKSAFFGRKQAQAGPAGETGFFLPRNSDYPPDCAKPSGTWALSWTASGKRHITEQDGR
jgi:hypothetical protein